jgi:hypothetical protein
MQKIVKVHDQYKNLLEFRDWLMEFGRLPQYRVTRPNGLPGRLTRSARNTILKRLTEIEKKLDTTFLSKNERELIKEHWHNPRYGDKYKE